LKLLPETFSVLKRLVLELSDQEVHEEFSKSSTFPDWIRQYYSYVEDGSMISGFRGKSLSGNGDAIFLNQNSFWAVINTIGKEKAIRSHCHTVIHEIMHLHSHEGEGANTWSTLNQLTQHHNPHQKLDEGFTEIFTRTIIYRMQTSPNGIPEGEIPMVFTQGQANSLLPVYEGLKNIACDIAQKVGLDVLARGYFLGQWDNVLEKLKTIHYYSNLSLWKNVIFVSHTANTFINQDDVIIELENLGLNALARPSVLHQQVKNGTYHDFQVRALYPFMMKSTNGEKPIHLSY